MPEEKKRTLIKEFIENFYDYRQVFVHYSYWFSQILLERFSDEITKLMFNPHSNTFAVAINGYLYNIDGLMMVAANAENCGWEEWSSFAVSDPVYSKTVCMNLIDLVPNDYHLCGYCNDSYYDDWGNLICVKDNACVGWNESCRMEENNGI